MSTGKHRLQTISIANFRGFTNRQEIKVGGRHLFLFGPNGYGKSSIVEAIRWCLFGSPSGQQEIEVRNTFFPSEVSEVILELTGGLKLQRQLRPGQTRSRQTISDSRGETLRERDLFPQLTRLGQPMGTQVIFAAQQATGRRHTDIADFSRVLYFHLGVEDIPELLGKLRQLKEERRNERQEMARQLDEFCQKIRNDLTDLEGKKGEILLNPPWGSCPMPTREETSKRISDFYREVAQLAGKAASDNLPNSKRLQMASNWNDVLSAHKNESLDQQLAELKQKKEQAEKLQEDIAQTEQHLSSQRNSLEEQHKRLSHLLDGVNVVDLKKKLARLESVETEHTMRIEIKRLAQEFAAKFYPSSCPVCGQAWDRKEPYDIEASSEAQGSRLTTLDESRRRIENIESAQEQVSVLKQDVVKQESWLSGLREDRAALLRGSVPEPVTDFPGFVCSLGNHIAAMSAQIRDAAAEHERRGKRIKDLEAEERFHSYQVRIAEHERILDAGVKDARIALADYGAFLNSADDVAKILLRALNNEVERSMTDLSKNLSMVFQKLTNHPSYNGVDVQMGNPDEEKLEPAKLELRVTSSRRPSERFPTNVLNGQAARALQLVHYFVFSDFWKDIMELELLLIDDPSESFDTSHIEHLMKVLKGVASHTQLVVASHEEDRVRPLAEELFALKEHCIIRVTDFDPEKGPSLE